MPTGIKVKWEVELKWERDYVSTSEYWMDIVENILNKFLEKSVVTFFTIKKIFPHWYDFLNENITYCKAKWI